MTFKLSICIPTLNRGNYIGETLESIVHQLGDEVEVVIVDGGSTDNTEQLVNQYRKSYPVIRYIKKYECGNQPSNEGFDRDCNHAVERANADYCWLMTDDDLLAPGSIRKILNEIDKGYALIVASVQVRNKDFTKVLVPKRPDLTHDIVFEPNEINQFAITVGPSLTFVGSVVVNQKFWLSRDREKYYGSGFVHVGVIFDELLKEKVLVIADPLVILRYGNAQWATRSFQIWMFNWPELIWSFTTIISATKQSIVPREPWRKLKKLLMLRAMGIYSIREYQLFLKTKKYSKREQILTNIIARLPRIFLFLPAYISLLATGSRGILEIEDLMDSLRDR